MLINNVHQQELHKFTIWQKHIKPQVFCVKNLTCMCLYISVILTLYVWYLFKLSCVFKIVQLLHILVHDYDFDWNFLCDYDSDRLYFCNRISMSTKITVTQVLCKIVCCVSKYHWVCMKKCHQTDENNLISKTVKHHKC